MKKIPRRVHVPVLPASLLERMRGPLAFVNMHPDEAMQWVQALGIDQIGKMEVEGEQPTFFFFDDTRAMTLDHNLRELDIPAKTESKGDLWDLSPKQTLVWTPQRNDERELKLDIIEQAWHALKPGGLFLVWLPTKDLVGTVTMVHKIFGRIHEIPEGDNTLLWAQRTGERSKRRHELTFTRTTPRVGRSSPRSRTASAARS